MLIADADKYAFFNFRSDLGEVLVQLRTLSYVIRGTVEVQLKVRKFTDFDATFHGNLSLIIIIYSKQVLL